MQVFTMAESEYMFDPIVDLTSPQSSVDASTKDRVYVQEELERRLKCRAGRQDLVQRNILPPLPTASKLFIQSQQLQRAKNADNLQKKLRNRPDRSDLQQLNILPDLHLNIDPALQAKQVQLIRSKRADSLNEKLANRPGPIQLIKNKILEPELAAVIEDVDLERLAEKELKKNGRSQNVPEISLQSSEANGAFGHKSLVQRHSIATSAPTAAQLNTGTVSPTKDIMIMSPVSLEAQRRKMSDSSLSPANSPGEFYNEDSRSPPVASPRGFNSTYPPVSMLPPRATHTPGILSSGIGKAPSPSQTRKKQAKQQKYRKLRYHEYVPPTKNTPKGGKQTPKSLPKSNNPYDLLLQQQQLFLQLQVLQRQYPNGAIMQKLPELINSLSKEQKTLALAAVKAGRLPIAAGVSELTLPLTKQVSISPQVPPVLNVDTPNKHNVATIRFDDLKVSDLKAACKEMGMIVSGKKAELVERLLEANKRQLPARALPDNSGKDSRRQVFSAGNASSVDSQLSGPPTVSPESPNSAPVFTFPSDQANGGLSHNLSGSFNVPNSNMRPPSTHPPNRVESMPNMQLPEVFPAATLQQKFEEMKERQKRNYISQKGSIAAKSIAPCPDLNELVAIKLPPYPSQAPPTYQNSVSQKSKGSTLPHRSSDSKLQLQVSSGDKTSRSLPSSPVSPDDAMLTELMDDTPSSEYHNPSGIVAHSTVCNSSTSAVATSNSPMVRSHSLQSPSVKDSIYLAPGSVPMNVAVTTSAYQVSSHIQNNNGIVSAGLPSNTRMHTHQLQDEMSLRHGRMSVPSDPMHAKVHPMHPPSYEATVQRSISLSGPHPRIGQRMHSGASFSSDISDIVASSGGELGNPLTPDNMLVDMDMPMETGESNLSEIFEILKADGTDFTHPGQPQSLPPTLPHSHHHALNSHPHHPHMIFNSPTKHMARQESTQSDSIMLGGINPHNNPSLANQHKSLTGSDLCLSMPGQDSHRSSVGSGSYNVGSNVMLTNELGWLDLENMGTGLGFSPTTNSGFGNLGTQSNPGSLPHDQFQMHFLDDTTSHLGNGFMKVANPPMNGCAVNPANDLNFLDSGLAHHSGLLLQSDENTLVELGLSTS